MDLHHQSIDIIRAGQAANGAYAACASFSQYGYSWLRDGTWIAYAMDIVGQAESARAFHLWAAWTLRQYASKVDGLLAKIARGENPAETDYLPTRFTLDGAIGKEEWPDFQLDGYGAWLWGLAAYVRQHSDDELWDEARPAASLLVRYLAALWGSPNYDCWEEHRQHVHTSTLAALYGGLSAIQSLDAALVPQELPETIREYVLRECVAEDGHFMKFVGNEAVDASLLWLAVPYQLVETDDPRYLATVAKIERDIRRPGGGVYRYAADTYYGGGEWLLLTSWLGWVYCELGRTGEAESILQWVEEQATPNGEMPEQVSGYVLDEAFYQPWVEKWGTSACPLLWTHAMYLILEACLKEGQR